MKVAIRKNIRSHPYPYEIYDAAYVSNDRGIGYLCSARTERRARAWAEQQGWEVQENERPS